MGDACSTCCTTADEKKHELEDTQGQLSGQAKRI